MTRLMRAILFHAGLTIVTALPLTAQRRQGKPIGKVTTIGNLIHIEVNEGVLVPEHLWAQVDRDFYWPTKGFSWFALYLMGLARADEVPAKDFFLLRDLQRTGQNTSEGYPIFTGERLQLSMDQVVAAMGPRQPAFEQAQKNFRTAIVIMTLPGKQPTPELIQHANAISERWVRYWTRVTGGRATMSISPR